MTKQTKTRRAAIVSQLSDLSKDGWSKARPADYQPLEAELRAIDQASAPAASSMAAKVHFSKIETRAGITRTSTACGRMVCDGEINATTNAAEVTCKLCRRELLAPEPAIAGTAAADVNPTWSDFVTPIGPLSAGDFGKLAAAPLDPRIGVLQGSTFGTLIYYVTLDNGKRHVQGSLEHVQRVLADVDAAIAQAPASSSGPRSYAFYIQEKRSPRGKFTMGNNPRPYRTAAEAFAMLDDLNEHGGCGPLRVVDQSLRLIERPIGLTWSIDDRGNHIAQAMRKYSVAYESTSAGGRYQVRVDGYPIGQAPTEAEAKAIAQAHHDRPAA